jgi:hypothetical protein
LEKIGAFNSMMCGRLEDFHEATYTDSSEVLDAGVALDSVRVIRLRFVPAVRPTLTRAYVANLPTKLNVCLR